MPESSEKQTLKTIVEPLATMRENDNRNSDRLNASIGALTLNVSQLATQQEGTAQSIDALT